MQIRITKSELGLIHKYTNVSDSLFVTEPINETEIILSFIDVEKASKFDELLKDQLVYQGFDIDYNPNRFGEMCENLIDKMYNILN